MTIAITAAGIPVMRQVMVLVLVMVVCHSTTVIRIMVVIRDITTIHGIMTHGIMTHGIHRIMVMAGMGDLIIGMATIMVIGTDFGTDTGGVTITVADTILITQTDHTSHVLQEAVMTAQVLLPVKMAQAPIPVTDPYLLQGTITPEMLLIIMEIGQ